MPVGSSAGGLQPSLTLKPQRNYLVDPLLQACQPHMDLVKPSSHFRIDSALSRRLEPGARKHSPIAL